MGELHPINRSLLTILENQQHRTDAALEGLAEEISRAEPGGGCKSIRDIGRHLLSLRRFQLTLLRSSRLNAVPDPDSVTTVDDLRRKLEVATDQLRRALAEHDPDDWYAIPDPPRAGKWGELPTIERFTRPFNDFVNHLGSIRAIRRIGGHAAEQTQ